MKKQYINPEIEVVNIETHALMAGSPGAGGEFGGGGVLSREGDVNPYWDEEDDW
ncbi:MAG: hypothetical protein IJ527_09930 [Prevotella sp.]|nr:hypothetical protein [Prevotella sp.]